LAASSPAALIIFIFVPSAAEYLAMQYLCLY
jgi:hypothetical protein